MLDLRSSTLVVELVDLASRAGAAILQHRGCTALDKSDGSPVTEADHAADAIIAEGLARVLPGIPVLSEERVAEFSATDFDAFVLVDPLDGTKEFIAGRGEFTVNIAIVVNGAPVTGVVFAPAVSQLWTGAAIAEAMSLEPGRPMTAARDRRAIHVRRRDRNLTAVASRSHRDAQTDACLSRLPVSETRSAGSSLKFCLVAEGLADIYPRFGPTMEWDTAAGHAVVTAAGGIVTTPECQPFLYAKSEAGYRNGPFIAASCEDLVRRAGGGGG